MRKRARLLVIDDQEFAYERLFERDGYNLTKWKDIENLEPLENGEYDVILLDIQGVGKQYSEEQGLGILRHIRKSNPTQIVIAYSGDDYKLDINLADQYI
jgi:CheY-like chemotaxis protein